MWLQTAAGTRVQITAIDEAHRTQRVHNLTVDGQHTFFALVGASPVLVHSSGVVPLNCQSSQLAQVSMNARMTNRVQASQNVAVYLAAANDPGGLHSEEILNRYVADPANGISADDALGVYSERVPFGTGPHSCSASLNQYSNLAGNISWSLNLDGIRNGRKNAGAIARAMGSFRGAGGGW